MDRLHTMSLFVGVAEEGGFAAAARRFNTSPPSVTRAVSELEARLGARLFHRTTRSVRLTEAGERYLADCRRILAEVEDADRHAAGSHGAPHGMVSVSASVLYGRMVVTPILFDLMDRFPEISISTVFVDRVVHLLDEGIDIAVRIAELPSSALSAIRVGDVRRVICAAPGYLANHGRPRDPADLADHETVDYGHLSPGGEWTFEGGGGQFRFRPRARFRVNNVDSAIAAVVAGRGIARVLSYQIEPQLRAGSVETLLEDFEPPVVPIHVLHKEPGQTSARVRAVVDVLVDGLRHKMESAT
jgi:DNA-binding transcriptional LysR family regulator